MKRKELPPGPLFELEVEAVVVLVAACRFRGAASPGVGMNLRGDDLLLGPLVVVKNVRLLANVEYGFVNAFIVADVSLRCIWRALSRCLPRNANGLCFGGC